MEKNDIRKLIMSLGIVFSYLALLSLSAKTNAMVYQFSATKKIDTDSLPKVTKQGKLVIVTPGHDKKLVLPAYQINVSSGGNTETGWEELVPNSWEITTPISPALYQSRHELAAYFFTYGWFIAPKNWQLARASIGGNGSSAISLIPKDGTQGHISFFSTANCSGCAMSNSTVFFPQYTQQAKENEFYVYTSTSAPVKTIPIRRHTVAYQTKDHETKQRIDGLTYFNPNAVDNFYHNIEVSLTKHQQHLATPLLNWWLTSK